MTTFRYRLTLLCRVRLPQGPRLPYMRTIVTFRFDTTLAGERSFFRDTLRTIVFSRHPENDLFFRDNRRFFAVGAHRRSLADRPGGPLVHQHLLAGLCCNFTSTCLLDFAASSPALAYWTFLHLKVRNWSIFLNCTQFLGLCSSI